MYSSELSVVVVSFTRLQVNNPVRKTGWVERRRIEVESET